VIFLHGGGGTALSAVQSTQLSEKADAAGFAVVYPEGTRPDPEAPAQLPGNPQFWNDGSNHGPSNWTAVDDTTFIADMIDDIGRRYPIDPARIYAAGFSNGGAMALRLGVELSARLAAVAAVAGHLWLPEPAVSRPVPLIYFAGTDDPVVPIDGGTGQLPWSLPYSVPPVRHTIERWAALSGLGLVPVWDHSQPGYSRAIYGEESARTRIDVYVIAGMGHNWPGGRRLLPKRIVGEKSDALRANDVMWRFFSKFHCPP